MTETPEQTTGKEMLGDKAIEMAEVALIHNDLNTCIRLLRTMKERYLADNLSDQDQDIKLALFRDVINLYVSAFVGTGYKLDKHKVYAAIEGQPLEFFQWTLDIRNSYAAHTFGPARQCVTMVMIDPKSGLAAGVGPMRMDLDIVTPEAVDSLANAILVAGKFAEDIGRALNDELLAEAEQMSPEALAALPNAALHVPGPQEMMMERHNFRRIKTGQARPPKQRKWRQQRDKDRRAGKPETP